MNWIRADGVSSQFSTVAFKNKYMCFVTLEGTPTSVSNGGVVASGLPKPLYPIYLSLEAGAGNYSVHLDANGSLTYYYLQYTTPARIDATFMYPVAQQ